MKVYEMCLDDSCSYRTEDTIANNTQSILNDELDNQVITKGEQITTGDNSNQKDTEIEENLDAEDKRKQIGDEFYRESEDIEASVKAPELESWSPAEVFEEKVENESESNEHVVISLIANG